VRVFFVLSFTLLLPINAFAERHIATIGIQKVAPVALPSSPTSQGSYVFGLASTKAIAGETPKAATPTTPSLPIATAAVASTIPSTGQPYAQPAVTTTPATPATAATTPVNQQAAADAQAAQAAQAAAEEAADNAQQQNQQVQQQVSQLRDQRAENLERKLTKLEQVLDTQKSEAAKKKLEEAKVSKSSIANKRLAAAKRLQEIIETETDPKAKAEAQQFLDGIVGDLERSGAEEGSEFTKQYREAQKKVKDPAAPVPLPEGQSAV